MFRNESIQRAIATLLLSTFTTMSVVPSALAAQALPQTQAANASEDWAPLRARQSDAKRNQALLPPDLAGLPQGKGQGAAKPVRGVRRGSADGYADALVQLDALARVPAPANGAAHGAALQAQYARVAAQSAAAMAAFADTEAQLLAAGLPAEIVQRHRAAAAEFAARNKALEAAMKQPASAPAAKAAGAGERIRKLLDGYNSRPARAPQGAPALPWGRERGMNKVRPVAMTERQHEALFPRSIELAAVGSLSGIRLPDAVLGEQPGAADLAANDDVQLTPEIRALAAKLANNPVQMYNWVRNNVRYTPGYGAMQGAAATLQSGSGNAYDTASLLVALNRAAGIPARYVYGTVEVPLARMQSWLGADSATGVQALLNASGIPNQAVQAGGKVAAIQFEHVWVHVYADFSPSRGAVNKVGRKWMPLDASFKLSQEQAGLDLRAAVGLNEGGLFDAVKTGAACTVNQAQGLDLAALGNAYADYQRRLATYLAQQGEDLTAGDVLGQRVVRAENYSILLGTLPYKTVATGAIIDALPPALQWQYRFNVFADATAQAQDQPTATLSGPFAALGGKRITLSFAPATEADAATLAAYLPPAHTDGSAIEPGEFPADVPAYLIRLKAELRADGELVASGGSFIPGSALLADVAAYNPANNAWRERSVTVRAGEYHAVAIDAQGVSAARLLQLKTRIGATAARIAARQTESLTRDDVSGDVLYQAALAFFGTADSNAAVFQQAAKVTAQRLPSYGRAVATVRPHNLLGIIHKVSFPGVTLDIDRMDSAVAARTGGLDAAAYQRQSNQRDASYARLVLAKLFSDANRPATAVSAINAMAKAAANGQAIHAVTASNLDAEMGELGLTGDTRAAVENAAGAGYRVLVPAGQVSVGGWSGHPLQIEELATGAGSYQLFDDLGSATANVFPLQGMGWLALAQPFQSGAVLLPAMVAAQSADQALAGMLGLSTVRWSFFAAKTEVGNGLFLARLAAAQGALACDAVTGIVAANLGTVTGLDGNAAAQVAAPVITSVPVSAGVSAQAYRYAASATDPQNLPLTWRLMDAPTGMAVSNTGIVTWSKAVSGSFAVTLRADNGRAFTDQRYVVTVGDDALPLEVSLGVSPGIVNAGENVTLTVVANGGSGNRTLALLVDGQPVALDGTGKAVVNAMTPGAHTVVASATDSRGTVDKRSLFSVRVAGDTTAPQAEITSPVDDAEVTASMNIVGTAADDNLAYYQLLLRPAGDQQWREIGSGSASVTAGVLGKLDPTQLANGIYELALNVVDANGAKTSKLVTIDVYRDLKIGQFAITFEDLHVEASGIPIRVSRTYDTRTKADDLDFGYGWTVDYQSSQIRKNITLGLSWEVTKRQLSLCLTPAGQRKINVTLPGGKVERFKAHNAQECAFAQVPPVDVRLTALPGTNSKLEIVVTSLVEARGGHLYDMDNFEPWNPKEFKLTTEDDYVYYLTDGIGITRVKDPSGNTLTYGRNGILHSSGQSVAFTRDQNDRITAITDPAGKQIRYGYNAAGDLVSVTDRTGAVSKFSYNRSHGLVDFTDPMGVVATRYAYDPEGRLIAVYDAAGKAMEITRDLSANKEVIKDRRGNETTYVYDSQGNVTERIDALNNKETYTFDALGNAETTTDANGKVTRRSFDPKSGKQLTEINPLGHKFTSTYDETRTRLTKTTDARNNVTSFTYGTSGSQGVNEPLGRASFQTIENGNLVRDNVAGQVTTYTYDTKGNKKTSTDAAGNVTTYGYDANGKETSRSTSRTIDGVVKIATTTRKLDAEGRVLEETDPLGFTNKATYNAGGQVTSRTDAQGRITTYEYNTRGKLVKTGFPDGSAETIAYDAEDNEISTTDRQGRKTLFDYDALNRLVKTTYPDGSFVGTEYDAVGRVTATIDTNNKRTVNTYDDAGRIETRTDPDQKVTRFGYDENSNLISVTDANQNVTRTEYDALNRPVLITAPGGATASTVWNVDGTKKSESDFDGSTISYGYDALGRLNKVTQTNGATEQSTQYELDNLYNKTSQLDAEGRTTKWTYDLVGQVTSRTLPAGQVERFEYDANGSRIRKVDFAGQATRYGYSDAGLANLVVRPDGTTIVTTHTQSGQVETITVSGGSTVQTGKTTYAYDAGDRLVRQTNPDGSFIAYAYDAAGNISERSTRAGTVRYAYDAQKRLEKVTDVNGKATSYTYEATGKRETIRTPNGVTSRYRYSATGYLTQLAHTRDDGSIVSGARYSLKPNGHKELFEEFDGASTQVDGVLQNPSRTTHYVHDGAGRLVQEKLTARGANEPVVIDYAYDKVGNRITKTLTTRFGAEVTSYEYDQNDRLIQEARAPPAGGTVTTVYRWDAKGNLSSKTVGTTSTYFIWNSEDQLVEVKSGASEAQAQSVAKYRYDVNGNRVTRIVPGVDGNADAVTRYVTDTTFAHAETLEESTTRGTASTLIRYTRGNGLISQANENGVTHYQHVDGIGSTNALTDANGATAAQYVYDAFGNAEINGASANAHRYTGEYFDDAIGLQYNRARWYDANVGRFVSQDPFAGVASRPVTNNKYVYANSNPTVFVDPTGMMAAMSMGAGSISASMGTMVTVNLIRFIGAARSVSISVGGTAYVANQGPRIAQTLQQTGLYGFRALQSSIYMAARGGTTAQQLTNAHNLGSRYTDALNRLVGARANSFGLQIHKLIEGSAKFANNVTYSLSNMVPTPVNVHKAISAIHSTNLPQSSQTLRAYISAFANRNLPLADKIERLYAFECELWTIAMARNGGSLNMAADILPLLQKHNLI